MTRTSTDCAPVAIEPAVELSEEFSLELTMCRVPTRRVDRAELRPYIDACRREQSVTREVAIVWGAR
jgi:hypothetical protein